MNYLAINQWNESHVFDEFYKQACENYADKIIILGQREYEYYNTPYYNELQDLCASRNQPLYVVTGAHSVNYPHKTTNVKIDYWDTGWLGFAYRGLLGNTNSMPNFKISPKINIYDTVDYKYYFISMNRNPHPHRLMLVDLFGKHDLFKYGAVSAHMSDEYADKFRYWSFKRLVLDSEFGWGGEYNLPQQYYQSFMQVISESPSIDTIIISEKTSTALFVGKPFLIAGSKGYHKFLKLKNFELYDEIFDYSFDDEPDQEKRYDMLLENVKRITSTPLNELNCLREKIAPKVKHNQELARKIAYDESIYPKVVLDIINHYKETGNIIDVGTINDYVWLQKVKDINW